MYDNTCQVSTKSSTSTQILHQGNTLLSENQIFTKNMYLSKSVTFQDLSRHNRSPINAFSR